MFLQCFDTVGWVIWPVKCVWWDVKPYSINPSCVTDFVFCVKACCVILLVVVRWTVKQRHCYQFLQRCRLFHRHHHHLSQFPVLLLAWTRGRPTSNTSPSRRCRPRVWVVQASGWIWPVAAAGLTQRRAAVRSARPAWRVTVTHHGTAALWRQEPRRTSPAAVLPQSDRHFWTTTTTTRRPTVNLQRSGCTSPTATAGHHSRWHTVHRSTSITGDTTPPSCCFVDVDQLMTSRQTEQCKAVTRYLFWPAGGGIPTPSVHFLSFLFPAFLPSLPSFSRREVVPQIQLSIIMRTYRTFAKETSFRLTENHFTHGKNTWQQVIKVTNKTITKKWTRQRKDYFTSKLIFR